MIRFFFVFLLSVNALFAAEECAKLKIKCSCSANVGLPTNMMGECQYKIKEHPELTNFFSYLINQSWQCPTEEATSETNCMPQVQATRIMSGGWIPEPNRQQCSFGARCTEGIRNCEQLLNTQLGREIQALCPGISCDVRGYNRGNCEKTIEPCTCPTPSPAPPLPPRSSGGI